MVAESPYSKSSTRQGTFTPVGTPDFHADSDPSEKAAGNETVSEFQDDLALGFGLMRRAFDRFSLCQCPPESGTNLRHNRYSEILPDKAGRRLHSEICTIRVGPSRIVFQAHREVLAQSPIFAALLEHKSRSNQAFQLSLLDQDPTVFRRVLQYLYGQTLPVAASEGNEHVLELVDGYIMACRLELEELQSLIIRALERNEGGATTGQILCAAGRVYQADEARPPFGRFFVSALENGLEKEGFAGPNNIGDAVDHLITQGGTVAKHIGEGFRVIYARGRKEDGYKGELETQVKKASRRIEELEDQVEAMEADTSSTSSWSTKLKSSPTWGYSRGTMIHSKRSEARKKHLRDS